MDDIGQQTGLNILHILLYEGIFPGEQLRSFWAFLW